MPPLVSTPSLTVWRWFRDRMWKSGCISNHWNIQWRAIYYFNVSNELSVFVFDWVLGSPIDSCMLDCKYHNKADIDHYFYMNSVKPENNAAFMPMLVDIYVSIINLLEVLINLPFSIFKSIYWFLILNYSLHKYLQKITIGQTMKCSFVIVGECGV